ncbi:hypothetical protein IAC76_04705 [Spirochaetes bacterium]|uniref:Tetratricopeptide repeat protein n=1 Tax=Candidatus Scatousia excrementipullorum TaxID=2840936 RepID=A0A9D9DMM3_9BACT|nr:hypothetical protein [Candidatus Scatousia excrementipullorum]
MNKKLVLLLAAIFLTGAAGIDVPAMAVSGPFGYDLQKDIHRNKNKEKEQKKNAEQNADKNKAAEPVNTNVTDDDIFVSSIAFNKAYYPNASMKSAVIKYKKGNYTGSLQELYTLVKKNPQDALAYYYVGMAYTKIGAAEPAKAAYQKVINLSNNQVLVDYATRGRNCLTDGISCAAGGLAIGEGDGEDMTDLDKFIAAPYGNGMSPEMTEQYKQQQLNAIQNKINNGKTLSPDDVQRLKDLQNNKSEVLTGNLIAMADGEKKSLQIKKY